MGSKDGAGEHGLCLAVSSAVRGRGRGRGGRICGIENKVETQFESCLLCNKGSMADDFGGAPQVRQVFLPTYRTGPDESDKYVVRPSFPG